MDDKKERILTVANKMVARFGFKKTTMDEIAQEAHMGKSTLYYYFKSKEDIFAEIIRRDSMTFRQKLEEAILSGNSPQEKIRSYVLARMKHLKELSNYYTTLTDEYLDHYFFVEEVRSDFYHYENETLRRLLIQGINDGIFAINDVEITVRMIAIAIKGLEYPLLLKKETNNLNNESSQMLNILFKGIETR